jgi:hypothetical protein
MSVAGKRSSQGDEYQVEVAMHWIIRLLSDDSIDFMQVESTGAPGVEGRITVDDVVIRFLDGHVEFIQAKKNQPKYSEWKFSDSDMVEELKKAAKQLAVQEDSRVFFYSRSPFGEIEKLAEDCRLYHNYESLARDETKTITGPLEKLKEVIGATSDKAYNVAKRLFFGPQYGFEEWKRNNLLDMERIIPQADLAYSVLRELLQRHQASLPGTPYVLYSDDLLKTLASKKLTPTPMRSEVEIQSTFRSASAIGRSGVIRGIGGVRIPRKETGEVLELVRNGAQTVLLTSGPGSGKTCVLLDLAERIEADETLELLFIKGDLFAEATTEDELTTRQLPEDIAGQCARLSKFRRVVVLLDSLDVLSLNRSQGALGVFLRILDRLGVCDKVSVIAACRTFDLIYDASLQGRSWDHKIEIAPLDFETEVSPLLKQWGASPAAMGSELRELLRVPRNLLLFEKLATAGSVDGIVSALDLHERYIEEAIVNKEVLGESAKNFLAHMAHDCMQRRSLHMPKAALRIDNILLQALLSENVLIEPKPGTIGFAHQTLAECFAVREAVGQGMTLLDFILGHPPLPFIRPAVRAFFQHLRAHDPDGFRRQTRAVLESEGVTYHLKRLVCESLGEVVPQPEDFPLVRRLFNLDPDLFSRFLLHAIHPAWLPILSEQWLPIALGVEDKGRWLNQFAEHIKVWSNDYPAEVVALWRRLLVKAEDKRNIIYTTFHALSKYNQWHSTGVRELLEELLSSGGMNRDCWGGTLSKFVEATDSGDDIIWNYITEKITPDNMDKYKLNGTLRCDSHDFHSETFLAERFKHSDILLSRAIESIEMWSKAGYHARENYTSRFLDRSSYGERYTEYSSSHVGDIEHLLNAIELAFICRAKANDRWWQTHEPIFRTTHILVLRYFSIVAYQENIQQCIIGIEHQLQDKELLENGNLEKVIQVMANAAYPYISEDVQTKHQEIVDSCYKNERFSEEYSLRRRVLHYLWIPCVYRTHKAQAAIDLAQDCAVQSRGAVSSRPRAGWVQSPISAETLSSLSEKNLIKLLVYYNDLTQDRDYDEDGNTLGGRDSVARAFGDACALDPLRFIPLFSVVLEKKLNSIYAQYILSGVASHLNYRVGAVHPQKEWQPIEPLPPIEYIAKMLLSILSENMYELDAHTLSCAVEACCHVLLDQDSIELLSRILSSAENLDSSSGISGTDDLITHALNSPLGIMAESSLILANNIFDNDLDIAMELKKVILKFSRLDVPYVHAALLSRLPFTIYKAPAFGWEVFNAITEIIHKEVWEYTELCLYYNYHNEFQRVAPFLERIFSEALGQAGKTWGSIATLAYLSGHIDKGAFFEKLFASNDDALAAATSVFAHNIEIAPLAERCHAGLLLCLRSRFLSPAILSSASSAFDADGLAASGKELAIKYLQAVAKVDGSCDLFHFARWLPLHSRDNPLSALEVLEELANAVEASSDNSSLHLRAGELSAAFMEVLREADEVDDAELIRRVVSLQDRFLRLNVGKIHVLYEQ